MRLDLRACETLAVSLPTDTSRRASVTALCNRLGLAWRLIDGVEAKPARIGCALGHLRALRAGAAAAPLLILEDDVEVREGFDPAVEVPDDADALYLGVSLFGSLDLVDHVGFSNMIAADPVSDRLVRTYNMLGAHAILYISERFRAAAEGAILRALVEFDHEHDRELAKLQQDFVVYALRRPLFYQAAALQARGDGAQQEAMTRIELVPLPEGMIGQIEVDGAWRTIVLRRDEAGRLRWCWQAGG